MKKPRMNVFWQFFSSFFILILVPSILASLFTYVYVVRVIEHEVEETSSILIGHFAEQTDELVDSLRDDMLRVMSYSNIQQYLRYQDYPAGHPSLIDAVHSLTTQVGRRPSI
ncbi:hypothetical protein [Paenibacillus sp. 1P07SE]|uniref:hypothetical protein n=1 Tax=Paenibacillus sp. 1P07SE TaxID=3132209 RepID=UPI0039A458EC